MEEKLCSNPSPSMTPRRRATQSLSTTASSTTSLLPAAQLPSNAPPTSSPPRPVSDLTKYRLAIGINLPPPFQPIQSPSSSSSSTPNTNTDLEKSSLPLPAYSSNSLYQKIIWMIKLRRFQTILLETLYYTVFTTQVLIGAVLASLGASDTIHPDPGVIMALGGFHLSTFMLGNFEWFGDLGITNACLAGILALLKGQCVLEQLSREGVKLRELRDWVEEWDVRFGLMEVNGETGGEKVEDVVKEIWERFGDAQRVPGDVKKDTKITK
ncbi:hypothetical protein BDZ45DRAFT_747919 [Acephala macrosclerotiorum]|nr:hypothetical protein BDZ45DRAFT_747919 [Acephala macrosclerotiorum]